MPEIDQLFRVMLEQGASDLHLLEGQPAKVRKHGNIEPLPGERPLAPDRLLHLLRPICPPRKWRRFERSGDVDFAYGLPQGARFRANYYRQAHGLGAVFRVVPAAMKGLAELGAPPILKDLAELRAGMVLVTGPTGSGKSTTLAAMLDHINANFARKVVTLEDPIEFVHPPKRSFFVQREVGDHCESFAAGLRAAVREDCDVILVGEMRDLETISLAVTAAETGALVFGTLHTNSAGKTVDRIVNVFPAGQRAQVLSMLSTSLRAVISQQLVRRADGKGRVAVHEVLVVNSAASAAIREGQVARLNQVIQTGRSQGMVLLDDALMARVKEKVIAPEEAYLKASDKRAFEPLLGHNPYSGG